MSYPYVQQPRPEQKRALKKIFRRKTALVAGDMGTGKTKIGVDFIANMVWHKKVSRAVVIAPLEAIEVWKIQIEDNCPFLSFTAFMKDKQPNWQANVILINYDYVCPRRKKRVNQRGRTVSYIDKRVVEALIAYQPDIVILDESHKIKRPTARRSKAIHALGLEAEYKICLTGTPSGNKRTLDLWSQFRFIRKDLLDDKYKIFKQRYARWGGWGGFQFLGLRNEKKLYSLIRPYTIRIKKTGLPGKNFIPYPVTMPESSRRIYREMEDEFIASIGDKKITAPLALAKAIKLSQISGGFIKDENKVNHPVHTAKVKALEEILDNLQENSDKVVIFARFLWEIDRIKEVLTKLGWKNIHRVKGRVTREVLDKFNTEGGAMVCQTASGSGSNNFQAANYMIFYSTDYSLINFLQACDRIHRIGQTKPCFYYFLQCKGTIDKRIYRLLRENKDAADNILSMMEEIRNDNSRGA